MSTDTIWRTSSSSSDETEQLAETLGKSLRGGEVIELVSDLGGGKTTFVRGLARGAGCTDKVASPSFTISKIYRAPDFEIQHFDFYKLPEAGLMANELSEVVGDPQVVVVMEWAEVVQSVLPKDRLTITIDQEPDGTRRLTFEASESLGYLMEALR